MYDIYIYINITFLDSTSLQTILQYKIVKHYKKTGSILEDSKFNNHLLVYYQSFTFLYNFIL